MQQLKLKLAEHIAEEEEGVFKETKKVLSHDQLMRLGEQMKDLFDREMAGEPSESLSACSSTARDMEDDTMELTEAEIETEDSDSDSDIAPL
jgi:hypothetical protein